MIDLICDALEWVMKVPPVDQDSPEGQRRDRRRTRVASSVALMGVICLFTFSFGLTPFFPGFARSSDVAAIRVSQIDKDILDYRRENCIAEANAATKRLYMERIEALLQEYRRMTGTPYSLPACSDL